MVESCWVVDTAVEKQNKRKKSSMKNERKNEKKATKSGVCNQHGGTSIPERPVVSVRVRRALTQFWIST